MKLRDIISREHFPVLLLIVLAAFTRLIPHPFNFTAVGAIALFSGVVVMDKRFAFIIPVAVLFITDLFLGFHLSMLPVYTCFAFTVGAGIFIRNKQNVFSIAAASILSSTVFFIITNLPIWYVDQSLYPLTIAGTFESYRMAIPFFKNQLAGDLFYNAILFGAYHLISEKNGLRKVKIKA